MLRVYYTWVSDFLGCKSATSHQSKRNYEHSLYRYFCVLSLTSSGINSNCVIVSPDSCTAENSTSGPPYLRSKLSQGKFMKCNNICQTGKYPCRVRGKKEPCKDLKYWDLLKMFAAKLGILVFVTSIMSVPKRECLEQMVLHLNRNTRHSKNKMNHGLVDYHNKFIKIIAGEILLWL